MSTISSFSRITVLAAGIAGALAIGQAHGAAFQLKENSAKAQGRAFAGSASAPDDTAIVVNNPAGMRLLDGRQFEADASVVNFSAKYHGNGGSYLGGLGGPVNGGNGGDAGTTVPLPALYFHQPLGDNMHLGASVTVPYGFKTEYDRDWVGRYQGTKTDLQAIDAALAFSYDVNPYVSFGASVFGERLDVDLSNAIDFGTALYAAGLGAYGFAPGNADGALRVKGHSTKMGFTLGGLFSIDENTNIGMTYRSRVKHKITNGTADFTVPAAAAAVLSVAQPGAYVDSKGRANLIMPATATLSVFHRINERWSVMGDVTRTAWSKFDKINVNLESGQTLPLEFDYRDTTFVSIGADYKLNETVTLRGGLAYDQTPTTNENRDVRVPDNSRKWASIGASWTPSEHSEWNIGYTHLFASDSSVNEVAQTGSTLAGSFAITGDVLAASYRYKF